MVITTSTNRRVIAVWTAAPLESSYRGSSQTHNLFRAPSDVCCDARVQDSFALRRHATHMTASRGTSDRSRHGFKTAVPQAAPAAAAASCCRSGHYRLGTRDRPAATLISLAQVHGSCSCRPSCMHACKMSIALCCLYNTQMVPYSCRRQMAGGLGVSEVHHDRQNVHQHGRPDL